jgi:hypothetical protein
MEIVASIIIFGTPPFIIYPILRPHLQRIKREFLFQHYVQSQALAKGLATKSTKLPVHEVEEIIRRSESKVRL